MGYKRKDIYLIFPYDKDLNIAGVYVGSSRFSDIRIDCHLHEHKYDPENDHQRELHELMRENGFEYLKVDTADFNSKWKEYIWIDMFCKYTNLTVYNKFRGCYGKNPAALVYRKYWGVPSTIPLFAGTRTKGESK